VSRPLLALLLVASLVHAEDAAAQLEKGTPEEQRSAMRTLADQGARDAGPAIARIAEAPGTDLLTRQMAVSCLASLRDRASIPTLLRLLKPDLEPDLTFRGYVADQLAAWTHQCIPFLAYDPQSDPPEAKKLEESSVNGWATWWLQDREKTDAQWIERGISRALELLKSPDESIRAFAIQHLKTQTDLDFDYDPQGDPAALGKSIEQWDRWWTENRSRVRWDAAAGHLVIGG